MIPCSIAIAFKNGTHHAACSRGRELGRWETEHLREEGQRKLDAAVEPCGAMAGNLSAEGFFWGGGIQMQNRPHTHKRL